MINNIDNRQFYIGIISKISPDFSAEIKIFEEAQPFKNCKFFGPAVSEVLIGDEVLVLMLSRELFLYTPLKVDSFLGLQNGVSRIDLTTPTTITINSPSVIVESPNVQLGSNQAKEIPLCLSDLSSIQVSVAGITTGNQVAAGTVSLNGIPKILKVKAE